MATSSGDDEPLSALFRRAEVERAVIESSSPTSADYGTRVATALALYERVQSGIRTLSIFSRNEAIDDVSTTSLPMLSVEARLAELELARWEGDRSSALRRAREKYEGFLNLVEAYDIMVPPYDSLLERFRLAPDTFSVVDETVGLAARRDAKIASFRAEKNLRMRIDEAARLRNGNGNGDGDEDENGDDELLRSFYLAELGFVIHASFNGVDAINRELQLLSHAPPPTITTTTTTRSKEEEEEDDSTRLDKPLNNKGPLLSRTGKPLQPFTLVGTRADRSQAVFRPGHNLPTMSVDEYLAEERRRGGILDDEPQSRTVIAADENQVDDDVATYKARAWDDFKDDNPRGSGNTLNMG